MMGVFNKRHLQLSILACALSVVMLNPNLALSSADTALDSDTSFGSLYYTVDEDQLEVSDLHKDQNHPAWTSQGLSSTFISSEIISTLKQIVVNLLKWTEHDQTLPNPEEKYIRKLHFGRWINDPYDETCMNTRARVLVSSSEEEVTYRGNKRCVVATGLWKEPYAGKTVKNATEIQIDHMVPLKNAYVSGAWQWDYKTRCLYANYTGYQNHLIPSDSSQNQSKGDRAPDKYLPINESYRCQYVRDWLAVKLIWKLNMTAEEVQGIADVVDHYNCDASTFKFTQAELEKQRQEINGNLEFCMINKR